MRSPVFPAALVAVLAELAARAGLFMRACMVRAASERAEDLYLVQNFCDVVDHRGLGRHVNMCVEAGQRISDPIMVHATRYFIDTGLGVLLTMNNLVLLAVAAAFLAVAGFVGSLHAGSMATRGLPMHAGR